MKHATFSRARAVLAVAVGVAIVIGGLALPCFAQDIPGVPAAPPPVATPAIAMPPSQPAMPQAANAVPATPNTAPSTAPGAAPAVTVVAGAPKTAAPDDTNPFSNVKPVDNQALKQELPVLEKRLQTMENQMSAIQQVGAAIPADALNAPGATHRVGAPVKAPIDEETMELQASTFIACVNGQALFRDTDQKPFFVDAKEANQNEAVHRIGGCKH